MDIAHDLPWVRCNTDTPLLEVSAELLDVSLNVELDLLHTVDHGDPGRSTRHWVKRHLIGAGLGTLTPCLKEIGTFGFLLE